MSRHSGEYIHFHLLLQVLWRTRLNKAHRILIPWLSYSKYVGNMQYMLVAFPPCFPLPLNYPMCYLLYWRCSALHATPSACPPVPQILLILLMAFLEPGPSEYWEWIVQDQGVCGGWLCPALWHRNGQNVLREGAWGLLGLLPSLGTQVHNGIYVTWEIVVWVNPTDGTGQD